jgi:hypothetical protein
MTRRPTATSAAATVNEERDLAVTSPAATQIPRSQVDGVQHDLIDSRIVITFFRRNTPAVPMAKRSPETMR